MTESIDPAAISEPQKITITLTQHDLKPPVYVAGSFTSIPWEAEEMDLATTKSETGEISFTKTFLVHPGEYHYKFRLGDGDWWICDEQSPIVKDEAGNSNNQLIVSPIGEEPSTSMTIPNVNTPLDVTTIPTSTPQVHTVSHDMDEKDNDPSAVNHEGFLGTWEPHEGQSPMHRRASTNLGVRISRIGTFLPPETTSEDSKDDEELEVFPSNRQGILARMETLKKELPEDDSSQLENVLHDRSTIGLDDDTEDSLSSSEGPSEVKLIPNLDGELGALAGAPGGEGMLGPIIPWRSASKHREKQLAKQRKSDRQRTSSGPTQIHSNGKVRRRQPDSQISKDSLAEEKVKAAKHMDHSESVLILVIFKAIAAWFRRFWDWLIGKRRHDENEPLVARETNPES